MLAGARTGPVAEPAGSGGRRRSPSWGYYQASFLNASFGGVQIGGNYLRSNLQIAPLVWIYVTNLLGIVFTLGLFYPWAKVRQTRYQLENMAVDSDGNLSRLHGRCESENQRAG